MSKLTANIIGATGLVGTQLVQLLINDDRFEKVSVFTRRPTVNSHSKLTEHVIDFNDIDSWSELIQGDVLFSTLGTTIKTAGTQEKQYLVDYTYQFEVAQAASKNGVSVYVLVSSTGANSKSRVFYSKMKGQLDDAVQQLNFKKISIIRPSILDGDRNENRTGEKFALKLSHWITKFLFKKYRPIKDIIVAQAMINSAINNQTNKRCSIYELEEVFELADNS